MLVVPVALYLVILPGEMEINSTGITRRWRKRTYYMAWQDVERFATDGQTLVLSGRDKQFVITPMLWPREISVEVLERIFQEVVDRGVSVEKDGFASWCLPRNKKI